MGDDPPYLMVGTEVSAKYKGAFCEAKIKSVGRSVKCKVTFKASGLGSIQLGDDQIRGELKVGSLVEAKYPTQNVYQQCTINKIQDCSQYTVVFDDGDIATLRRSALCLKSGRHFNESETLDQLPLTHPEHFSNPVMGGRRAAVAKRVPASQIEDSDEEEVSPRKRKRKAGAPDIDLGKVVYVESNDKKKSKDNWFPALVVNPAQDGSKVRAKDSLLVRSFKDGRYYSVPKKELTLFTKDSAKDNPSSALRAAIEGAVKYMDKNELPVHWDREALLSPERSSSSRRAADVDPGDVSEPETAIEETGTPADKKRFMLELQKFMEAKGTPMKKGPVVCNKELDLHKLYEAVREKGGYTKVSGGNQWKHVIQKIGFGTMPSTSTINQIKQAYKRFLHDFEEDMDKKAAAAAAAAAAASSVPRARASRSKAGRKAGKQEKAEEEMEAEDKGVGSDENESESTEEVTKKIVPPETPPRRSRSRQEIKMKTQPEVEPADTKKSTAKEKEKEVQAVEPVIPSTEQPATPKSARSKSKRVAKEDVAPSAEEEQEKEAFTDRDHIDQSVKISMGDRLRVHYGPKSDRKLYEAKVNDIDEQKRLYLVHYTGWNTRYDEWISIFRIAENLTLTQDGPSVSASQGRGPAQSSESATEDSPILAKTAGRGVRSKRFSPTPSEQGSIRGKTAAIKRKRKSEDLSADTAVAEFSKADSDISATSSVTDVSAPKYSLEEKSAGSAGRIQRKASTSRDKETLLEVTPKSSSSKASQHAPESAQTQPDVYEFEDDLAEAPKFKTISPRSPSAPGKKEKDKEDKDTSKEHEHENSRKGVRDATGKDSAVKSASDFTNLKGPAAPEQEMHTKVKDDVPEIEIEEPVRKGRKSFMKKEVLETSSIPTTLPVPTTAQVSLPLPTLTPAYISTKKSSPNPKLAEVGGGLMDPSKSEAAAAIESVILDNLQRDSTPTPVEKQKSPEAESYPKPTPTGIPEGIVIQNIDEPVAYERKREGAVSKRQRSPAKKGQAGGRKSSLQPKIAPTVPSLRKGSAKKKRPSPAAKRLAGSEETLSSSHAGVSETDFLTAEEQSFTTDKLQKHEDRVQAPITAKAILPQVDLPLPRWVDTEFKAAEQGTQVTQAIPLTTGKEKPVIEFAMAPPAAAAERSITPTSPEATSDKNDEDGPKPSIGGELGTSSIMETPRPVEIQLKIEQVERHEAKLKSFGSPVGIMIEDNKELEESCSSLLCEEEIPKSPPPNEQLAEEMDSVSEGPVIRLEMPEDVKDEEITFVVQEGVPTLADCEKERKGLNSESSKWKSKFEEPRDPVEERERADLYDVYSPDGAKASPLGIDSTPPATPDSTNSGNVSSDFEEHDPQKGFRTSKRMSLLTKRHSDTDSVDSIPAAEANAEDDGSMLHDTDTPTATRASKYKGAAETGRGKRDRDRDAGTERTTRQSAPRKSEDEYSSGGRRNEYRRLQDSDMEDAIGFTLTLPPMTIPKPPQTTKYYFIPELGEDLNAEERISIIATSMHDLKEKWNSLKSAVVGIERKQKKQKRREKEKDADGAMLLLAAGGDSQPLSPTL